MRLTISRKFGIIGLLTIISIYSTAFAEWKYNPYTGKLDFYLGTESLNATYMPLGGGYQNFTTNETADINWTHFLNVSNLSISAPYVPPAPNSAGVKGQISYDSTYFYTATDTNTWKRVAWATWAITRTQLNTVDAVPVLTIDGVELYQ